MPGTMFLLLFAIVLFNDGAHGENSCAPCRCEELKADCRDKGLADLPEKLPTNITDLVFRNNSLKLTMNIFTKFGNLRSLDISHNNIRFLPNGTFQGLENLKSLNLDQNPFSYDKFHRCLFCPLQNLIKLRLQKSNSSSYPNEALQVLKSLKILHIDGIDGQSLNLTNLVKLSINGTCDIAKITNRTFINLRSLTKLHVVHCKKLNSIEKGSFAHLKQLRKLSLSYNSCLGMYGLSNATEGISKTSIEILIANQIEQHFPLSVIVPERLGQNLNNTGLRELQMDDNKISGFDLLTLKYLPRTLKKVSIKGNRLNFSPYIIYFPSLSIIDVDLSASGDHFKHGVPKTLVDLIGRCSNVNYKTKREVYVEDDIEIRPELRSLNWFFSNVSIGLPGNLTTFKWSGVGLRLHLKKMMFVSNKVKLIDVSRNLISEWIGPIYGFKELTYLNLSINRADNIGEEFFDNFPSLTNLDISYNFLENVLSNDTNGRIFKNLNSLKVLNLTQNSISRVHRKTFYGLRSLERLIMSHNGIFALDFKFHINLLHIDLTYNEMRWLSLKFIRESKKQVKTKHLFLDLGNNPLSCTCRSLITIKLIAESDIDFGNISSYMCLSSDGEKHYFRNKVDLTNLLTKTEYSCRYFSTLLGVTAAVLLILCVIIGGIIHRFRWKLRYWYFAAKYRYNSSREDTPHFNYDAFLSYAEENREFVVNEMVNKLESEEDFMLNIHQRDFTPGRPIAENIIEAIQTSKRTVCILSRSFLASYWCMYELQMANMERVTTGRDVLLIIMMEQIPVKDIPAEILYHIQTNSYLEYPTDGDEDLFWRNLTLTLQT